MELVIVLFLGVAVGAVAGFVVGRGRAGGENFDVLRARHAAEVLEVRHAEAQEKAMLQADLAQAQATAGELREQVTQHREQRQRELAEREKSQADESKVLQQMAPLLKNVDTMQRKVDEIEKQRSAQAATLGEQILSMLKATEQTRSAADSLSSALRNNSVRGTWGEMHLENLVEQAGLLKRVDYNTQASMTAESGARRPDMVINLPGGKQMAIDSKVPMDDFLDAQADDVGAAHRDQLLAAHAKKVRAHVDALAGKTYWSGLAASPEFTIAYIPNEQVLGMALSRDPGLIEYAFSRGVVLASPVSLWAVLKAVAFTWQQDVLTEDAKQLFDLGKLLYERIATMSGHVTKLGRSLEGSVNDYNKFISSLESRVLVTARKLNAVDETKLITAPAEIEAQPRRIVADEFTEVLAEVERPELEYFDDDESDDGRDEEQTA